MKLANKETLQIGTEYEVVEGIPKMLLYLAFQKLTSEDSSKVYFVSSKRNLEIEVYLSSSNQVVFDYIDEKGFYVQKLLTEEFIFKNSLVLARKKAKEKNNFSGHLVNPEVLNLILETNQKKSEINFRTLTADKGGTVYFSMKDLLSSAELYLLTERASRARKKSRGIRSPISQRIAQVIHELGDEDEELDYIHPFTKKKYRGYKIED